MRHCLHLPAVALGLAALLLTAGPGGVAPAMADEITIEADADIVVESDALEGLGALELNGLTGNLVSETPAPTTGPTLPPETPKPPRWITSVNYSKSKISFENEIWSIMTRKWGLADFQAAGLMSSIQAESSFCPYNVQGRGGSDDRGAYAYDIHDSLGFGLCQWTSSGRKAALQHYAVAHGSADLVWDFDTQMGFMLKELDMDAVKATRTLYEAAEWTVMRYERPNQRYVNSWPGTRYEKGLQIYKNHTGKDYVEPALCFSVKQEAVDALAAGTLTLVADEPLTLTVDSNYYWRLTQAEPTVEGWLEARCASFYRPEQTEVCVCGYPCDGEKAVTLNVATPPGPGETYTVTLQFEIFRGDHEIRTLEVSVTGAATE